MDLIGGYLVIILILFTVNISLLLGNYKLNNLKLIIVSLLCFIATFIMMIISDYLIFSLYDYLAYLFFATAVVIFALMLYYLKTNNFKASLTLIMILFLISTLVLSSQTDLNSLYSLFVFIVMFIVYQLTKLLRHAKRQYSVIVGEYMSLFSILIFIFSLTYNSTRTLDYTMFSSFLILTPTYQLIYVVIIIVVILIVGVLINEGKGGDS